MLDFWSRPKDGQIVESHDNSVNCLNISTTCGNIKTVLSANFTFTYVTHLILCTRSRAFWTAISHLSVELIFHSPIIINSLFCVICLNYSKWWQKQNPDDPVIDLISDCNFSTWLPYHSLQSLQGQYMLPNIQNH